MRLDRDINERALTCCDAVMALSRRWLGAKDARRVRVSAVLSLIGRVDRVRHEVSDQVLGDQRKMLCYNESRVAGTKSCR